MGYPSVLQENLDPPFMIFDIFQPQYNPMNMGGEIELHTMNITLHLLKQSCSGEMDEGYI